MDHRRIREELIIDSYLMGHLLDESREEFEAHLLECAQCQDELNLAQRFAQGLREIDQDELRWATRPHNWWRPLALAASLILCVTGSASIYLYKELDQARTRSASGDVMRLPVLVMSLVSPRSVSREPVNRIALSGSPQWLVLELEGQFLFDTDYEVTLSLPEATPVYREILRTDYRGLLVLAVDSRWLDAKDYEIRVVSAADSEAQQVYRFRVQRDAPRS